MTWLLRPARPADLPALMRLARKLDSINLPYDESVILEIIRRSVESFAARKKSWTFGHYVFVLEDPRRRAVVGSSQIIDKHGIVNRPHICFKLINIEKHSRTMDRRFTHTCLKLEWNPEGITEIGGLILDERYRSHPDRLGKLISYVRFLYMAMHPDKYRPEILAELLPPLDKSGGSPFWEHIGKKFTGMDYKEANAKCRTNAEFMFSLFPHTLLYMNLLPEKVRKLIGAVHPKTRPAKEMLEHIGFRYTDEVCPFDGGPHLRARFDEVTLIKRCRVLRAVPKQGPIQGPAVLIGAGAGADFRACAAPAEVSDKEVAVSPAVLKLLSLPRGRPAAVLPL